jgi:hypothetical protein
MYLENVSVPYELLIFLYFLFIFLLCKALIDKSGMVYSQEWVNGNIRGNLIGKMPKDMLLVCLVAKRFVKAGELLLMGLVRDLEVCGMVQEAIKEWNLEEEYPKVRIQKNIVPTYSSFSVSFDCKFVFI